MNIGKYVHMYSDDLRLKNYCQSTIDNYCSQVKCFLEHFNDVATKPSEISDSPKTTAIYLHTSDRLISKINSPIESIKL